MNHPPHSEQMSLFLSEGYGMHPITTGNPTENKSWISGLLDFKSFTWEEILTLGRGREYTF